MRFAQQSSATRCPLDPNGIFAETLFCEGGVGPVGISSRRTIVRNALVSSKPTG